MPVMSSFDEEVSILEHQRKADMYYSSANIAQQKHQPRHHSIASSSLSSSQQQQQVLGSSTVDMLKLRLQDAEEKGRSASVALDGVSGRMESDVNSSGHEDLDLRKVSDNTNLTLAPPSPPIESKAGMVTDLVRGGFYDIISISACVCVIFANYALYI
jgi:hypothetical protein